MQDTTTPETEVGALTEDQAAQHILSRWNAKESKVEEPKEAPEQPQQEQAQADVPDSEEPDADVSDDAEDAEDEIDVAGEKYKLPKKYSETAKQIQAKVKELEAGSTRKFQEAASLREAAEKERQAVAEMQKITTETADLLADHRAVSRRLQQLESIDIQSTDAETLTRLNAEYVQLNAAKQRIEAAYQEKVKSIRDQEAHAMVARQEHAEKVLTQRIKGWGPELKKELAEYAVSRGAPAKALEGITEAWMVEILADAAYGRKMREHKTTVEKRVTTTQPTLKPGASAQTKPAVQKASAAMDTLKKTGSTQDAIAALLARSALKRK